MIDLKQELERELGEYRPPDLWERIRADASTPVSVAGPARGTPKRRAPLWLATAAFATLFTLIGAAVLRDGRQTVDTTPATEPSVVPEPTKDELRPNDEVSTVSCRASFGVARIGVHVKNSSSLASRYATTDYVVRITIRDGTGTIIGEALVTADDVESGELWSAEVVAPVSDESAGGPEVMNCIVDGIERVPSR